MLALPACALPFIVAATALAGFLAGTLIERVRWNALVRDGIIPPPPRRP